MLKFYKYLLIILGASALFDVFYTLFIQQETNTYTIISFKVNKIAYLIYKSILAASLIIASMKTKVK